MVARNGLDVVENWVSALGAPDGIQNGLVIRKGDVGHVLLILMKQLRYHELRELLDRLWKLERAFQDGRSVPDALIESADEVLE